MAHSRADLPQGQRASSCKRRRASSRQSRRATCGRCRRTPATDGIRRPSRQRGQADGREHSRPAVREGASTTGAADAHERRSCEAAAPSGCRPPPRTEAWEGLGGRGAEGGAKNKGGVPRRQQGGVPRQQQGGNQGGSQGKLQGCKGGDEGGPSASPLVIAGSPSRRCSCARLASVCL